MLKYGINSNFTTQIKLMPLTGKTEFIIIIKKRKPF
jgi:hypothetical protein